jgi:hypothetical protein
MTRALALACVLLAAPASAQPPVPVSPGQRVRLAGDTVPIRIGEVMSISATAIRLAGDDRDIAIADLNRAEVSRGQQSKWKRYAVRGALVAAAIGAVSLGAQHESVGTSGASVGKAAALGAWSGGLFGGVIGGAVGATRRADRWEQVWP